MLLPRYVSLTFCPLNRKLKENFFCELCDSSEAGGQSMSKESWTYQQLMVPVRPGSVCFWTPQLFVEKGDFDMSELTLWKKQELDKLRKDFHQLSSRFRPDPGGWFLGRSGKPVRCWRATCRQGHRGAYFSIAVTTKAWAVTRVSLSPIAMSKI